MVNSNDTTYGNVISVLAEKHNRYIFTCITTYAQVAPVCLTLHGQHYIRYKNVFTYCGRDHKTLLGPHTLGVRLWLVTRQTRNPYRMIGTVLK
jgi:hypothetical protein